ncbi:MULTISPECIES: patatin-like protein [unclassified Caballeronia]|uniref:patatin-like protein n=1 Tax=unclassified Caballeronia TaxID=2646786 RepID=UPI002029365B|nr:MULTISPECIES: patatin-like protein [unclassified Caballeronia]
MNGAALSLALVYDSDFRTLRDVWMDMGTFGDLLRDPLDKNPGSLLRGDEYFLPQIKEAFSKLAKADQAAEVNEPCPNAPERMPIDLRLTTTLLRGRPACTVDDLGTPVGDMDHRARFRFQHTDGEDGVDHFKDRVTLVEWLSRAARSTASFPFAFEPSKVRPSHAKDNLGQLLDVNDTPIGDQPRNLPRCVVDGGILDNKPFRGALRSIFAMKTQRSVRRVIAYINPDPGKSAQEVKPVTTPITPNMSYIPSPTEPDPQLGAVVGSSLFGIPQSQAIIDQLNEVQAHNARVRTRRNKVLDIVGQFVAKANHPTCKTAPDPETTACALFELYRKRRIAYTFDTFVNVTLPAAALNDPTLNDVVSIMGKNVAQIIRLKFENAKGIEWIPKSWPSDDDWDGAPDRGPCARNGKWNWGQLPVDFAAKVLLNLLRLTTEEVMRFIEEARATQTGLEMPELVERIAERFGLTVQQRCAQAASVLKFLLFVARPRFSRLASQSQE